jgi:hypothetical protein
MCRFVAFVRRNNVEPFLRILNDACHKLACARKTAPVRDAKGYLVKATALSRPSKIRLSMLRQAVMFASVTDFIYLPWVPSLRRLFTLPGPQYSSTRHRLARWSRVLTLFRLSAMSTALLGRIEDAQRQLANATITAHTVCNHIVLLVMTRCKPRA